MASIERRTRRDGTTAYRVTWRERGTKQSETLTAYRQAVAFRGAVDDAGQRWPAGWVPGRGYRGDTPGTVTVKAWTERAVAARTGITDGTRAKYLTLLATHVWPSIGDVALADLDQEGAARWFNALAKADGTPLSPKSLANIHGLLSSCLNQAVAARQIEYNPAAGMTMPRADGPGDEMLALTVPEFDLLLSCLPVQHRLLVRFLARSGLRWGEATALMPRHVVPGREVVVEVRQAWKPTPGGGIELGPPKTRKSRRSVPIYPASLADDLLALAATKGADELLFTTSRGYVLRNGTFWTRVWSPAVDLAVERGLTKRPRLHDLRHTHVSWLIAQGVDQYRIQARLGHESIKTTIDRYGHWLPQDNSDLEAALSEGGQGSVTVLRSAR